MAVGQAAGTAAAMTMWSYAHRCPGHLNGLAARGAHAGWREIELIDGGVRQGSVQCGLTSMAGRHARECTGQSGLRTNPVAPPTLPQYRPDNSDPKPGEAVLRPSFLSIM